MTTRNRLAQSNLPPSRTPQQICDEGNARIAAIGRDDIEWFIHEGRAALGWKKTALAMLRDTAFHRKDIMDRRGQRMSEADTFRLNKELEKLGSPVRYRLDGSRHTISEAA